MKWNMVLSALLVSMAMCCQSYGAELFGRLFNNNGGGGCCTAAAPSCAAPSCAAPSCAAPEPSCGAGPSCAASCDTCNPCGRRHHCCLGEFKGWLQCCWAKRPQIQFDCCNSNSCCNAAAPSCAAPSCAAPSCEASCAAAPACDSGKPCVWDCFKIKHKCCARKCKPRCGLFGSSTCCADSAGCGCAAAAPSCAAPSCAAPSCAAPSCGSGDVETPAPTAAPPTPGPSDAAPMPPPPAADPAASYLKSRIMNTGNAYSSPYSNEYRD